MIPSMHCKSPVMRQAVCHNTCCAVGHLEKAARSMGTSAVQPHAPREHKLILVLMCPLHVPWEVRKRQLLQRMPARRCHHL